MVWRGGFLACVMIDGRRPGTSDTFPPDRQTSMNGVFGRFGAAPVWGSSVEPLNRRAH